MAILSRLETESENGLEHRVFRARHFLFIELEVDISNAARML